MSNINRTSATCFMRRAALALVVASLGAVCAYAQGSVPNAVQGFSQNRDQPIHIDAAQLEVRDKDRVATFSGDVKVVQGDTTMRARTLQVFYDQQAPQAAKGVQTPAPKSVMPGPAGGNSQIRRLEAKGNVIVTQKDQVVTGETGVFDMRANTVTVTGGVVLTRGEDVLQGRSSGRQHGNRNLQDRDGCRPQGQRADQSKVGRRQGAGRAGSDARARAQGQRPGYKGARQPYAS